MGVVLTMVWVIPFDRGTNPDAGVVSSLPQLQKSKSRDGWRLVEFNKKVFITLPPDMRPEAEMFGDSVRYFETYSNGELGLTLIGDILVPVPDAEVRKKKVF